MNCELFKVNEDGSFHKDVQNRVAHTDEEMTAIEDEYSNEYMEKEYRFRSVRVLNCCGEDLALYSFTNTCDRCGSDYNMSGQKLADRSQWGSETGEHWTDCY